MKYILELPDEVHRNIKMSAAKQGISMKKYILDNVTKYLWNQETPTEECDTINEVFDEKGNHLRTELKKEKPEKADVGKTDTSSKKCKSCSSKDTRPVVRKDKTFYVCDKHYKTV